jgi:hypothetical protein
MDFYSEIHDAQALRERLSLNQNFLIPPGSTIGISTVGLSFLENRSKDTKIPVVSLSDHKRVSFYPNLALLTEGLVPDVDCHPRR